MEREARHVLFDDLQRLWSDTLFAAERLAETVRPGPTDDSRPVDRSIEAPCLVGWTRTTHRGSTSPRSSGLRTERRGWSWPTSEPECCCPPPVT